MTQGQVPRYEIADFFQARMPLLPFDAYGAFEQGDPEQVQADPLVQRALVVGSVSLFDELSRADVTPRDRRRRTQKLLRYQIRMATRPTPYGLFAGVALGYWGERTNLELRSPAARLNVRPDMDWLLALIWELESVPEVRRCLTFSANTAILSHNDRLYVLSPVMSRDTDTSNKAPSLRATPPVLLAMELARQPVAYPDLHRALCQNIAEASEAQVAQLLDELWRYGLLLSDLRPALTAPVHPARALCKRLASIPCLEAFVPRFRDLLAEMENWSIMPHRGAAAAYRDLTVRMHALRDEFKDWTGERRGEAVRTPGSSPDTTRSVLQVDARHELAGASLSRLVADEAERLGNLLMRLAPPNAFFSREFKQRFIERYGTEREVPLLEVLSAHFGPGDPFLMNGQELASWQSRRERLLLEIAAEALQQGQSVIELDDALLARLEAASEPVSRYVPSWDLDLFVAASSAEALERGDFRLIVGPNFGSHQAGQHMGRFADLLGPQMQERLRQLVQREQQTEPDVIWAEMVYLPYSAHAANVMLRPARRSHELVFGALPGVASEQAIPLDELVVQMRGERFVLRWPRDGREVRVTVGHMLNAMSAPPLVRFLELLPFDGVVMPRSFQWGAAEHFVYLPRVQTGKSIVSLARWKVTLDLCKRELPCSSPALFQQAVRAWCERWRVPRYVYLTMNDNRLLLDFEKAEHVEILRQELTELSAEGAVILTEAIPGPGDAWVPGPGGSYIVELNLPFLHRLPVPSVVDEPRPFERRAFPAFDAAQRQAMPGSDWLYMKLYVGPDLQNDLLRGPIQTFLDDALQENYIDNWFFIRYADPEPHLRLRFHGVPEKLMAQLMPVLCQWGAWLVQDGPCLRFTFETYDREIERYGGLAAMALCERLFGIDSRLMLDLLQFELRSDIDPLVLAAVSADLLVSALFEKPAERLTFYTQRVKDRKSAGELYRQHGRLLYAALFEPSDRSAFLPAFVQLLEHLHGARRQYLEPACELRRLAAAGELLVTREALLESLVHMHCNRLLGLDRLAEEQVVGLLLRVYESRDARARRATNIEIDALAYSTSSE